MNNLKSSWLNHFIFGQQNHRQETELIGAKAEQLKTLVKLGIATPLGFVINNKFAKQYFKYGIPSGFMQDLTQWLQWLESACKLNFGDAHNPLFVSVRSSPCISMPGLLPTVLNIGMCSKYLHTPLVDLPGFIDNYGNWLRSLCQIVNTRKDAVISWPDRWSWQAIQVIMQDHAIRCCAWLNDVKLQIRLVVEHILHTFKYYTQIEDNTIISADIAQPPGIIVQQMVWGNSHAQYSGSGVAFSRNPQNGKNEIFGDFVLNNVGEKLVSGLCQGIPLCSNNTQDLTMQKLMPDIFQQLQNICCTLEDYGGYLQDVEFTVDNQHLWILQTRNGKCTSEANIKITLDLLQENKIKFCEAVSRISVQDITSTTQSTHTHYTQQDVLAEGRPLSSGAVSGLVCFDNQDIQYCLQQKQNAILLSRYSKDISIDFLDKVKGLLTTHGASTSHVAVIARSLGIPFISSLDMEINYQHKICTLHQVYVTIKLSCLFAVKVTCISLK